MKIALFANTDWYLYGFRLELAKTLRANGHEVHFLSPPGDYHQELINQGFVWQEVQLSRQGVNPILELVSIISIIRLYHREKFDVCHHFTIKPVIYGSLAAKISKIPKTINAITGLGYVYGNQSIGARMLRIVASYLYRFSLRNTVVVFQNEEDQNQFVRQKIVVQPQTVLIQSSGVNVKRFCHVEEPTSTLPTVTFVGRLLWDKGVGVFVKVAETINSNKKCANFLLVGDIDPGSPNHVPPAQIKAWQQSGAIEWLGWQKDMPEIYQQSHIVCLPTSYKEGVPKVLLEAAASGRPIVASDIPGCRAIVQDGHNGMLVPPGDIQSLVSALLRLIQNPELRREFGSAGRKLVLQHFSVEMVNQQTIALCYPKQIESSMKESK